MSLAVEKPTPGLVNNSTSESRPVVSDATALRNTFRVLCGYCAYLILEALLGDFLRLPQWVDGLLRFIPYCLSSAVLAYCARPLLKLNKQTMFMALFLACLFVVFLTDVTKNLQFLNTTPILGADSRLRREVKDLAEIVAICAFLIGSYLMILETTRAKLLLSQEVEKLQRAEATLEVSEKKFRSIFEASNAGMFLSDLQGKLLLVNPALTRLLGYTTGEILGKSLKDFTPPEEVNTEASQISAVLAGSFGSVQMEKRYFHRDGHVVWGVVTLSLVRQDNGTPLYLAGQIQDITGRREAEEALHHSERRYRLISENTGDVIWTLDIASRRFTYVSPSVQKLRGYTPEEAMAQPLQEALTPDSYRLVVSVLADRLAAFAAGDALAGSWTGQVDQPRKDGSVVHTEVVVSALLDEQGRIAEVLGVTRDITKRKRVENDLKQSYSLLRATLKSTADGILVVDFQGKWVDCNEQFIKLWGIPGELLAERNDQKVLEFVSARLKEPDQFLVKVQQLYAQPDDEGFDVLEFKDGRVVERYSRPQRIEGRLVGRVWSFRDITERKRLEEQLRQAQKMEAVGQLAGGVAHDFNNLLTVIQGHCTLLQAEPQATANSRDSLKEIEDAARRATNLTRQLLTFSRRQVMQMKPLDLNEVLSHLLKMLRRLLGEDIALELQGNTALPAIVADEGMMEQVVVNLSVNARDAMPRGGHLTLGTRPVEVDAAAAEANPEARPGKFVCLTVSDTGCGMDLATRKRIFEPFFTTKDVGKGTGLGLATVYGIVKQHQGWIEVESEVGKGTVFRVFLPVRAASTGQPAAGSTDLTVRGGTETILLVEDESALRQLAKWCLNRHGYQVLEATNGIEAQALWREHGRAIALLLTDMVLPGGVNGLELAERLRAEKDTLKVLIATGYRLETSGAPVGRGFAYLEKPYEMAALAVAVRACLDEA
jgi:two-component system cell cycle sensor histidine kinase/response regulator CckA